METEREPSGKTLKRAIFELREPVVFRHLLRDTTGASIWKLLDWNMSEFAQKMKERLLPFRKGYNARTPNPQWDTGCTVKNMTMEEFLEESKSPAEAKEWYYFDYKYMHEWLNDRPEILASFDWHRFGLEESGADSTLWIGSKGAHTNCHQDSYGCNLVAQVYGRKQWLLFPPESGNELLPTRVPYEESTIYSRFNFFSPSKEEKESILRIGEKARTVVLEPGEVLLVPGGWWHYVESMDTSISVNIWLPLSTDCYARLREALVKLVVGRIAVGISSASDESSPSPCRAIKLVEVSAEECRNAKEASVSSPPAKKARDTPWTGKDLVTEYPEHVSLLPELESLELERFLSDKRDRFPEDDRTQPQGEGSGPEDSESCDSSLRQVTEDIVNALCHPDVIARAANLLLDTMAMRSGDL